MQSKYYIENRICWVRYQEDRTFEDAQGLIDEIRAVWQDEEIGGVILDLTKIEMMNSSGIGLLVQMTKEVYDEEVSFVIITNHYVHRVLQMVGLEEMIQMTETDSEAKDAILLAT